MASTLPKTTVRLTPEAREALRFLKRKSPGGFSLSAYLNDRLIIDAEARGLVKEKRKIRGT